MAKTRANSSNNNRGRGQSAVRLRAVASGGTMGDWMLAVLPLLPCVAAWFAVRSEDARSKILISLGISLLGFLLTGFLIKVVGEYTLRKGLSGKDLGKKGSANESKDIPEALGIVSGTVFLICTIASQLVFARSAKELIVYNSALFSICFMIFLGFTDDTLELKWRYKLILPTVASLPLLSAYSGSTAVYIPAPLRFLIMADPLRSIKLTSLGAFINTFVIVDTAAHGAIIELGYTFKVFMGLLAVFCTNSINILAGVNGLECGQSYIIACSVLFFKLYDLGLGVDQSSPQASAHAHAHEDILFAIFVILPFIGTSLALLRHNWFPASVFVGDTYCYFAGMTFAVVGIHGHFSKTLILLFLPQIFNFIYSLPQLFRVVPCPRHRLPRVGPSTGLMYPSTFPCQVHQHRLLKLHPDDTECPNFTILCVVLRVMGPMSERSLTVTLLVLQMASTVVAFLIRYVLLGKQYD